MAIVAADWTIDRATGNVRYVGDDHTGVSPSYATVIEFHRWLQDLADDAVSTGDDELAITDTNPSARSTDNIITLINGYNIDDNAAEHLYDGSIIQGTGGTEVIYDGIVNFGSQGINIQIIQNGAVIADDWWNDNGSGNGLNADATQGISHRFMLKVRSAGADIDGRRLIGMARTYGNVYSEFSINGTSRGNNVLALSESTDLNNATAIATVAGYTGITNTTEGYIGLDVNNDTTLEYYYSQWDVNTPTNSINDFYERMKWLSKDPVTEDTNADTGSNFVVDDATITGAAQSFTVGANAMLITKAVVNLKVGLGSPTGNVTASIYSHTGTYGSTGTPNTLVGTASVALEASNFDATYRPAVFNFSTPVPVSASTNYFLVIEHPTADASNYLHVEGLASSGTHSGNRAHNTAGWTAVAADDLNFSIYTSPNLYGIPGVLFRGITHEIDVDGPTGTFTPPERVTWSTGSGQLLAINSTTAATKIWIQLLTGSVPGDNITITGTDSGATVTSELTGGSITPRTISTPFVGASTGSAIIGSYGLGIETNDLTAADKVFDLTNTQITPPNNVTFTVGGLVSGEDRVLVAPWDGVSTDPSGNPAIDIDQLALNTTLSAADESSVVVTTTIPSDTPSVGTIRVELNSGTYKRVRYSSWSSSTFTIIPDDTFVDGDVTPGTDNITLNSHSFLTGDHVQLTTTGTLPAGLALATDYYVIYVDANTIQLANSVENAAAGTQVDITAAAGGGTHTVEAMSRNFASDNATAANNVYISYIDTLADATSESYTAVYSSDRDLVVVVRDGGGTPIKEFITSATFGNSNSTITAIRTTDA